MPKRTFRWRGETDPKKWSALLRLERAVDKTTDEFMEYAIDWLRRDIRSNWGIGGAPNTDTNNLDSNIVTAPAIKRRAGGQFATEGGRKMITVTFAAADGGYYHGRGEYIQALEKGVNRSPPGHRDAYPFLQPALDRLETVFSQLAKQKIRGR